MSSQKDWLDEGMTSGFVHGAPWTGARPDVPMSESSGQGDLQASAKLRQGLAEGVDREALAAALHDQFTTNRVAEWDDLDGGVESRSRYLSAADAVLAFLATQGDTTPSVSMEQVQTRNCPACGSPSQFEVRPPCSLDRYDPHDWHNPGRVTP